MPSSTANAVATELLVLGCQGGDERSLALLYARWNPRLTRHVARLTGRPEAVADVVQEVWLAIARGLRGLDDPARFSGWAYRIASRRSADWIRDRRRRAAREVTLPDVPADANDGQERDETARLRMAMAKLSPEHRAVLVLHYGEDLGVRERARVLGIAPGTVKSRLHHARRILNEHLERNES